MQSSERSTLMLGLGLNLRLGLHLGVELGLRLGLELGPFLEAGAKLYNDTFI